MYQAKVIGEQSAGLTGLEIYKDGELYWSMQWFERGADDSEYQAGMREVFDTALSCDSVEEWAEWEYLDGAPVIEPISSSLTWVVATYGSGNGWQFSEPRSDIQSADFIAANADRIPAEVVQAWSRA